MSARATLGLILVFFNIALHAFTWQDLWATKDQQGQALMEKRLYKKANEAFTREDWRAASAYRAKDYEQAAKLFPLIKHEDAYYNQGNALAHLGQYQQAINAYDKSLAINPNHKDALYNRKIVEDLLKKSKQNQNKQNQDKQNQDKQNQDKQNQDKQNQDKQNQDKQNQDKQNQDKQNQDKQIRISKIRISKIRISKIRISKTKISKIRISKTKISKTRISKIRISKIRISKPR